MPGEFRSVEALDAARCALHTAQCHDISLIGEARGAILSATVPFFCAFLMSDITLSPCAHMVPLSWQRSNRRCTFVGFFFSTEDCRSQGFSALLEHGNENAASIRRDPYFHHLLHSLFCSELRAT